MKELSYLDAYIKTTRVTRIVSLLSVFVIIVLLTIQLVSNVSYLLFEELVSYGLWKEQVVGSAFAAIVIVIAMLRFLLLLSNKRKHFFFAQCAWAGFWGLLLSWAFATSRISGSPILGEVPECMDCLDAFLSIPWRDPATYILVFYLIFSPLLRILNLFIAWCWLQTERYT